MKSSERLHLVVSVDLIDLSCHVIELIRAPMLTNSVLEAKMRVK